VTPEQAAEILLVRAAEESAPRAVAPEQRIDALEAAGDLDDERAWFARRARHLLDGALTGYRPLLRARDAFSPRLAGLLLVPFALGLGSNALGPTQRIHVLYNPVVLLAAWNLATYAVLVWLAVRPRAAARGDGFFLAGLRRAAGWLWLRAARLGGAARGETLAAGVRFLDLWQAAARPWFALRTRRLLHVAALGLGLGAIAGMYVRGLFFEYDMVWRSTFVREPATVARLLTAVLGPASLLLGRPAPSAADAAQLASEAGAPAAPWIHALALTALLAIVLPRAILAGVATRRAARSGPRLALGLAEPYFTRILGEARAIEVGRAKEQIGSAVREECARFAEGLAGFVSERLYDGRVVPLLEAFRARGGSVTNLEAEIRAACVAFEPELAAHLVEAERAFESGLARDVIERVRPDLVLPPDGTGRLARAARDLPLASVGAVGGEVSGKLSRDFGAALALAVGALSGTVSGGFGAHLGAAVLVALLHTTGPIAFAVGALGGAAVAAGALVMGRERVKEAVRGASLPGPVVRLGLRRGRMERLVARGRERCAASVRELALAKLEPLTDALADQVWARVKPLLARATQGACPSPTAAS
jgi:hypothetical protein